MLRHPCSMFIEDQYFEQIPHKVNKGSFQASCCNCLCKSFYIFHLFKTLWQNSQVLGPKKETPYVPWYPRFTDGVSNWGRYLKLPKKMPDSIRFSLIHTFLYTVRNRSEKIYFLADYTQCLRPARGKFSVSIIKTSMAFEEI